MDLLTIDNNVAIPSAYTLTVLEFKDIVDKDKSKGKNVSTKELAYVYFMCDHRSPFAVYGEAERKNEVKINVFGLDSKWSEDPKIQAACLKYKQLTETSAIRLLKAARESVRKLQRYFETIDLTMMDDNGKPIFHAKDLVANLANMGKVVNGLGDLEDLVKKQEQEANSNRGGVVVNKYSS
tara:strand:- start:2778 stop:3320 length:543 start_codon:yes stop_codon:yes gene_type:complete